MVSHLLVLSALRHQLRNPWQSLLSVLGIALGVAVIVAVDLANQSARQAFLLSSESLTGKATHQVVGASGVPESLFRKIRIEYRLRQSAPVVEGLVRYGAETLQLVGIDPFSEGAFRDFASGLAASTLQRLMIEPGSVLLSSVSAARYAVATGDTIVVDIAGRQVALRVVGLINGNNPALLEGLLLSDISTAQELLRRDGKLDRIDLVLSSQQADWLHDRLPAGLRLEVPATRTRLMAEMIDAFQVNLTAMSLLAMLVGAFLVFNTMTFSVLRQRQQLATLRIIGVTANSLFRITLLEALLLGLIGTAIGLLLGVVTANYLVQLVSRTINDLYFVLTVTQLIVQPLILFKGGLIGVGITLLATLLPALDAGRTEPLAAFRRSLLERRVRASLPWVSAAGCLALVAGGLLLTQQGVGLAGGFVALFLVIIGYSLLVPMVIDATGRLQRKLPLSRRPLLRIALRGVNANLSRTGLAIAALAVAVAATLGVSIMISSFRGTVADWLDYTLQGDIYISAVSSQGKAADDALPAAVIQRVAEVPGVAEISSGRRVTIISGKGPVELLAIEMASHSPQGFRFVAPPLPGIWNDYRRGEALIISEPFAYRHALRTGDELLLYTPAGQHSLPIAGIFYDYGSEHGVISLARQRYAAWWQDDAISTVGVYLNPGAETGVVSQALYEALADIDAALRIRSNSEIRDHSLQIFDRTFAITRVLRLLAIGVAFVGVLSALMALQLERAHEHAVLRATGVTPGQLYGLTLLQTTLMGLYAGLLALPLGWLMSEILIEVINRRAFGWSIFSQTPVSALFEAVLLAIAAALLAGLYPARRMSRVPPALALREE